MALPVLVGAGSAALLAVAPQIAVPVVAAYAANTAIQTAFRASEYTIQQAQVSELQQIAEHLETITQRLYDASQDINITEAVQRKPTMPDELHLHINTGDAEMSTDERWTASDS